jgi:hypothetical protein
VYIKKFMSMKPNPKEIKHNFKYFKGGAIWILATGAILYRYASDCTCTCCLFAYSSALKMAAVNACQMSMNFYRLQHDIWYDSAVHVHSRENPNSQWITVICVILCGWLNGCYCLVHCVSW